MKIHPKAVDAANVYVEGFLAAHPLANAAIRFRYNPKKRRFVPFHRGDRGYTEAHYEVGALPGK